MPGMKLLNENGFTFLNSLLDVVLLLVMLPLIVLFFGFTMSFSEDLSPKQLEWQLFAADFQTYLSKIESIEVINNGGGIRIIQQETEYDIEVYGNVIRKQKFRLGHEIMLTNIDNCVFQIEGSHVILKARFPDGLTKQAEYVFTNP